MSKRTWMTARLAAGILVALGVWRGFSPPAAPGAADKAAPVVQPTVVCCDAAARDQDDICIWVDAARPERSTVIASDKAAGKVIVYDLAGKAIQTLPSRSPGNIDIRYGFPLGGRKVDVVALNERADAAVHVYAVDAMTRQLRRIDDGKIAARGNYGGCLFRSPKTGRLYFFATRGDGAEQHELFDDGKGKVGGRLVRSWKLSVCEGAVGDDAGGVVYVAEESRGVWMVGGEPNEPTPGKLVARVGEHGLTSDVEGLTIYDAGGGKGYLLVSSQGSSDFKVYRRGGGHEYVGTFRVGGAAATDGIDVCPAGLGPAFARGLFACHSDRTVHGACPVLLVPWQRIAESFRPPLTVAPEK